MLKIYLIAGEASGDNIASKLMDALKKQYPDIEFYGVGGSKMQSKGINLLFPSQDLALMGFFEILPHIPKLFKRIKQTIEDICLLQPDALITIDSPGFCFRVAKAVKAKFKGKLIHYVAPTVWAYGLKRAKKIAKIYDYLLVILPFEPEYFIKEGLATTFVGHPAIEDLKIFPKEIFRKKFKLANDSLLLCLAPGSRKQEVQALLPVFLDAASRLSKLINQKIIIAIPAQEQLKQFIVSYSSELPIILVDEQDKQMLFSSADLALSKSGTITTELAFYKIPMVVAHKVNKFSYWLLKKMIKVVYVTIINLLAGKEIIPELLQDKCKAELIADELYRAITPGNKQEWTEEIENNLAKLQVDQEIPSDIAARMILRLLNKMVT